jgi:hypothetical protein
MDWSALADEYEDIMAGSKYLSDLSFIAIHYDLYFI